MLPFPGKLSLQTRAKLLKAPLNWTPACYLIKVVFKTKEISRTFSVLKIVYLYDLASCVVYEFQCGRCNSFRYGGSNYGDTNRYLKVSISVWRAYQHGEYISISSLNFKLRGRSRVPYATTYFAIILLLLMN